MPRIQSRGGFRLKLLLLAVAAGGKGIEDAVSLKVRWLQRGVAARLDLVILDHVHETVLRRLQKLRALGKTASAESEKCALGVHNSGVHLVTHDSGWPEMFREEASSLQREFDGHKYEIYHIGSTSIPGLAAKPIIDIAISLPENDFTKHITICRMALEKVGYRYLGNRGRNGGHMFERNSSGVRTHAIQVHPTDSPGLHETLHFRQMLLDDVDLAQEYAEIKIALAKLIPRQRLIYVWYKSHWLRQRLLDNNIDHAWGRWLISARNPTIHGILVRSVLRRYSKQ